MPLLDGMLSLVTGASRGIGRAVALRLASEGSDVALIYREDHVDAESTAREIEAMGCRAVAVRCDVSEPEDVARACSQIRVEVGWPDVVVNNAGVMLNGDIMEQPLSDLDAMMRTNVYSIVHLTRALGERVRKGDMSIVNVASNAGLGTALEGYTFYSVTKAAVMALTRRMAFDLGKYGVRVNAVAPGTVDTEMMRRGRSEEQVNEVYPSRASRTILSRVAQPGEIADAVLFLASPLSRFVTGQVLVVDGGRLDYLTHSL